IYSGIKFIQHALFTKRLLIICMTFYRTMASMLKNKELSMRYDVPHLINGKLVPASGRKLDIYNPAIGEVAGQVGVADKKIVDDAVQAAKLAFPAWSAKTPSQRAKILFKFKMLLDQNIEKLGQ